MKTLRLYHWPAVAAAAVWLWPTRAVRWIRFPPYLRLPEQALAWWQQRLDLQLSFDLSKPKGRLGLFRWFLFHGFQESVVPADASEVDCLGPLHNAFPGLPKLNVLPVTWLMREMARREGFSQKELRTRDGQLRLLSWFFRKGLSSYALLSLLTKEQAAQLLASNKTSSSVPRLVTWLWEEEPTLRERFVGLDDPQFRVWLRDKGAIFCPILAHPLIKLANGSRRIQPDGSLPFGVNLIGHARGRLGVGEDVRMAVKALSAVNIPFVVCDFPAGDSIPPDDHSIEQYLSDLLPYSINIFCTTGMETLRAITGLGRGILDRRWTIGFWPWELPEWPRLMQHAYVDMDEIWAASLYTRNAYMLSSPVLVRLQPMVVSVDESDNLDRADFGLPGDRFLFAFAYDGLSHATRKNPEGCLTAFERAFPVGNEPVGLVIKGLRVAESPAWKMIKARASRDPRIILIDKSLPRGSLLDLYRAVDCFVSLHRAEGFGRNIAEFMALGKPVIVTAYSGNMDFTTQATAALVPARLCALTPDQYPFGAGQHWAEPDISAASETMQKIVADSLWRTALARRGTELITTNYNSSIVGAAWAKALQALTSGSENLEIGARAGVDNSDRSSFHGMSE